MSPQIPNLCHPADMPPSKIDRLLGCINERDATIARLREAAKIGLIYIQSMKRAGSDSATRISSMRADEQIVLDALAAAHRTATAHDGEREKETK